MFPVQSGGRLHPPRAYGSGFPPVTPIRSPLM